MGIQFAAIDENNIKKVCFGIGREAEVPAFVDVENWEYFGWCYANARPMFALMGLDPQSAEYGQLSISEARRAVMVAKARFDKQAQNLTRKSEILTGVPMTHEDGTVEMRPVRVYSNGLDTAGIKRRLDSFSDFVEAVGKTTATAITWG